MRRQLVCGLFAVLAGAALSATGVTGVQASLGISRGHGASSPSPGSQLWAARYGATEFENRHRALVTAVR